MFLLFGLLILNYAEAQKPIPVDPMSKGSWLLNFGVGPGVHVFGNGEGFGPAAKVAFETGLWELGPGVLTLGAEAASSFFSHKYYEDWRETWINFMIGARSAYHYGWSIRGLDTYGGAVAGIGFCSNTHDEWAGYHTAVPVYPYLGVFVGASYFFTSSLGVNGEIGYNSTFANVGLVFRLQ